MFQSNCKSDRIFVIPHNVLFLRNSNEVTQWGAKHDGLSHKTSGKNHKWFVLNISTRKFKNINNNNQKCLQHIQSLTERIRNFFNHIAKLFQNHPKNVSKCVQKCFKND